MTYEEIITLKEKIIADEITPEQAKELVFKTRTKSWHTKDWKERRDKIIKDKCEQCGSQVDLTLQHFSHPPKFEEIHRSAFDYYCNQFYTENAANLDTLVSKEDILNYISKKPHEIKMVCPICSGNFHTRRNSPIHVCNRCKHEFNEPVSKEIPEYVDDFLLSESEKMEIAKLKKTSVKFYSDLLPPIIWSMARSKYLFEIEKKAMLDYLDVNIDYLSFKDTKTFCKKCAFNYDANGMDLCPKCKVNYKQFYYETCVECLPEGELKNRIKETRASNKAMYEYFRELDEIE